MIQITTLHARYGRSGPWVLDGLDLQVPRGSLFGLVGPNGAGKTTLVHILLGLLTPQSGEVTIDGIRIPQQRRRLAGRVGVAPQKLAFYPSLTVRENLALFERMRPAGQRNGRAQLELALQRTGLAEHRDKRAMRLSGGLKQRLNLAIALLGEPPLLLLDEPTAGVDPQSRRFILDALRRLNEAGTTIVYTTHYMDEVQKLCDRVAIMDGGRILVCDTLPALLCDAPDLEALFLRLTGSTLRG
ncbi:MAG: ABC transporter ATP-binding protein [Salinisphaera sp.]|nr:ABC transporter ATP-binding protein [Salinisphaera sp.]